MIVDAAFLRAKQRKRFAQLASALEIPFRIIECHTEHAILEQRISGRQMLGDDASEASLGVLYQQRENHEPLTDEERAISYTIDSTETMAIKLAIGHLGALIRGYSEPDSFSYVETQNHT